MKAAVFSDTHRNLAPMLEAVRRSRPDLLIHLGDHDRDALELQRAFPELPLYFVCGNCDLAPVAPLVDLVDLGYGVRALICHGHSYGVDWDGTDRLAYAAQERGCRVAMFGHTHRAMQAERRGVLLVNPGAAGKGRRLTWALVETLPNGGVAVSINELEA